MRVQCPSLLGWHDSCYAYTRITKGITLYVYTGIDTGIDLYYYAGIDNIGGNYNETLSVHIIGFLLLCGVQIAGCCILNREYVALKKAITVWCMYSDNQFPLSFVYAIL